MTDSQNIFGPYYKPKRAAEAGPIGFSSDSFDEIIEEDIRESDQFIGGRGPGPSQPGGAPAMMPPMMMGGAGRVGAPAGGAAGGPVAGSASPVGATAVQPGGTLAAGQGLPGAAGMNPHVTGVGIPGAAGQMPGGLGALGPGAANPALGGVAGRFGPGPGGTAGLGGGYGLPGVNAASLRGAHTQPYPGGFNPANANLGGNGRYSPAELARMGPNGPGGRHDFAVKPDQLRTEANRWQEVGSEMQAARRKMADLDISHEAFGKVRAPYPSYELAKQTSRSKADASLSRSEMNSSSLGHNARTYEQSDAIAARYGTF